MSTVAIIPARGGSKRIPRKNIRSFAGKPIIAYSISAARACGLFDRVIVSTDDEDIAQTARQYGAEIPFMRPAQLADDYTGTNAVTRQAIEWLNEHGEDVGIACCIYATAPFLQVRYLAEGHEKLLATGKSFAFSVTSYAFPIQRAITINPAGEVEAMHPENYYVRSQDLPEAYHDAGQFYWGTAEAFLTDLVPFSTVAVPVVLPRYLVQDIDTEEDWRHAEFMYRALLEAGEIKS
jgi:N-acylneuraminate cytidylyltransferase